MKEKTQKIAGVILWPVVLLATLVVTGIVMLVMAAAETFIPKGRP